MNTTFLKTIEKMLHVQREQIVAKDNVDCYIDMEGDETDEIQAKQIFSVAERINSMDRVKLTRINSALQKIRDGSFGKCEECEDDISEKRLLANPVFETCITCAELRELEEKRRR